MAYIQTGHLRREVVAQIQLERSEHYSESYCTLLEPGSWTRIALSLKLSSLKSFAGETKWRSGLLYGQDHYTQPARSVLRSLLSEECPLPIIFAHLMHKAWLFYDHSRSVKPAGDTFETIFAALYSKVLRPFKPMLWNVFSLSMELSVSPTIMRCVLDVIRLLLVPTRLWNVSINGKL